MSNTTKQGLIDTVKGFFRTSLPGTHEMYQGIEGYPGIQRDIVNNKCYKKQWLGWAIVACPVPLGLNHTSQQVTKQSTLGGKRTRRIKSKLKRTRKNSK